MYLLGFYLLVLSLPDAVQKSIVPDTQVELPERILSAGISQ